MYEEIISLDAGFFFFLTLTYAAQTLTTKPSQINVAAIKASGNFEVDEIGLSFKMGGRLLDRACNEGDMINAGQQIGCLEDAEVQEEVGLREAELEIASAALSELEAGYRVEDIAQAEAVVQRLKAQLSELQAGTRTEEIAAAKAQVKTARADAAKAANDFARQSKLHEKEAISDREFEIVVANRDMTASRLAEAEAHLKLAKEGPRQEQITAASFALAEAETRLNLLKNGPRKETIAQARGRLHQAERALALAKVHLENTLLKSPINGRVLTHNAHPGEYVALGTPVITVANLEKIWLRAFINETEIGLVKIGQEVNVLTDSFPGKEFKGKISFISSEPEFTPKTIQTTKERVKLMYRIKVDMVNPDQELKPGMPGDAVIYLVN